MTEKEEAVLSELMEVVKEVGSEGTIEMLRFGQGMAAGIRAATKEKEVKKNEEELF